MRRLMLATFAGAALLAGAGAASAQTFYDDGYPNGYGTPGYGAPYGYSTGSGSYYATPWNSRAPRGGAYKSEAFKSQEVMPQSPPGGGP